MSLELDAYALCPNCRHWIRDQNPCFCARCGRSYTGVPNSSTGTFWASYTPNMTKEVIPVCEMNVVCDLNEMRVLAE